MWNVDAQDLLIAFAWLGLHILLTRSFAPSTASQWLWAAIKGTLQLTLLIGILQWSTTHPSGWVTLALFLTMLISSIWITSDRLQKLGHARLFNLISISFFTSTAVTLTSLLLLFWGRLQWTQTALLIPLLGILLGNSLTSVALSVSQWFNDVENSKNELLFWLSRGKTQNEVLGPIRVRATQTALTGVMNSLTAVGLVSVPGVMTGSLLSGQDPWQSLIQQLIVLFLVGIQVWWASQSAFFLAAKQSSLLFKLDPNHKSLSLPVSFNYKDRLFLSGKSGCGKSTLLLSLAGLTDPALKNPLLMGKKTAWVPQRAPALAVNVQDLWFKTLARQPPRGLFEKVGRIDLLERNPLLSSVSGGELQCIHLLLALDSHPEFLLLDEPTSAMDPQLASRFEEILTASNGPGWIWVTHDSQISARFPQVSTVSVNTSIN